VNSLVGNPTISVGTIFGGMKTNVVPDLCKITVDRRLLPREDAEQAKQEIDLMLQKLAKEDPDLEYELDIKLCREGAEIGSNEKIVKLSVEACREVLRRDIEAGGFTATADMAFLVNEGKIPSILLGPGKLSNAHIVDEYLDISELEDATKIYAVLAAKSIFSLSDLAVAV